jgi:plastocyanin
MYLTIFLKVISTFLVIVLSQQSIAANLKIKVIDNNNKPVEYAVIYINETLPKLTESTLIIDQLDKEFIPYVTVVRRGSAINFPNNDNIRHQVYSFSQSKQFELPLYRGNEFRPVVFNKSGAVALACNIHDWMKAYVYVVDTNKFVVSDKAGQGVLSNLLNGKHEVLVWHPTHGASMQLITQKVTIDNSDQELTLKVTRSKRFKAWRAPKSISRRGY